MSAVDVLIPTCNRPHALAVTLTALCAQRFAAFRVVVSDQSDGDALQCAVVQAALRVLRAHGNEVVVHRHLPRRGMAEQRQFLLDCAVGPYALFLDDDVICEAYLLENAVAAIRAQRCGFVGCGLIGLSYLEDVRPHEQEIEFWDGPVTPEEVRPGTRAWTRWRLHNAANLYHLQQRFGVTSATPRLYRVAWVGGCVLYDVSKLRAAGGFGFWDQLPANHSGEDVLAQLRVMRAYGGCGILPSGAYHQELPTTLPRRDVEAASVLDLDARKCRDA